MTTNRFTGPIFIVGVPRSGTKLLRDLLNQNSKIGIPIAESHFIPYMIKRFGNPPRFADDNSFHLFYDEFVRTRFFWYMKGFGRVLNQDDIEKNAEKTSWASIFEVILRGYAPSGRDKDFIWGDKCPSYLTRINLLKDLFPKARFIHIIRDPRDCCLSTKKAWGRTLYSTAHAWRTSIEAAQAGGQQLGNDYLEVFFESLLEDPQKTLSDICDFLHCEFVSEMMYLGRPTENLGDAKGQTKIVQTNMKKYLTQLSKPSIKRIEEIVYPVMKFTPYEFEHAVEFRPVSSRKLMILLRYNKWNRLKFDIKTKGLREGLRFYYKR